MERVIPEQYSLSRAQRPQPRPGSRTLLIVAVYAVLVLGAASIGAYRLYQAARWSVVNSYSTAIDLDLPMTDITDGEAEQAQAAALTAAQADVAALELPPAASVAMAPINVLLLGTDDRPDEVGPARTDTIILLTLDPQSHTAGMLSLPRDLWVPIAGATYNAKINTAYSIGEQRNPNGGGPQLIMDTVSQLIGRPIDYYVRINFQGFVQVVDLLGGIDIMVPTVIHDEEYPTADYGVETFHLDPGLQHLDGQTALKFARTRHVDDDYGRSRRQQDVIRAVIDKVLSANMIPTLLPKAWMLISTMRSSIDTNIPLFVQYELAGYMSQAALQEIRQDVLDSRYGEEKITEDAGWILIPDREKVRTALEEFFKPASTVTSPADAPSSPQSVRIEVLNGTGEPGIAAQTRTYLEARGWQVVAIGDADRSDYSNTLVVNYGVPQAIIEQVRQALDLQPGSSILDGLQKTQLVDLRIVVGRDILSKIR
ncbi:MAG: LCP family protein [Caldilineaceae bacterium]|nr:LCP family protein [Caldilineaceae bacterium]